MVAAVRGESGRIPKRRRRKGRSVWGCSVEGRESGKQTWSGTMDQEQMKEKEKGAGSPASRKQKGKVGREVGLYASKRAGPSWIFDSLQF